MVILGISAYYHDSAAAILCDGSILAASSEERWSRKKHDSGFPRMAIDSCLRQANMGYTDIDYVVFYEKPFVKFERILTTHILYAPKGFRSFCRWMPIWLKERLNIRRTISKELCKLSGNRKLKWNIRFIDHHTSHAAMSYFNSDYKDAAVLVIDAVGENATTSIFSAKNGRLKLVKQQVFPNSIGLLYSSFTYFLGFKVNSDEYKVMGLAAYGDLKNEETKRFINIICSKLALIATDGSIVLNMRYFSFVYGQKMIQDNVWEELFGMKRRKENAAILNSHKNLAAAIQNVIEEILLKLSIHCREITGMDKLCLAGGCSLNCSAMGKLQRSKVFKSVFVPFSPGDDGGAIGAAMQFYYLQVGMKAEVCSPYLGAHYDDFEVENELCHMQFRYQRYCDDDLYQMVCGYIKDGKIVGWHQGKMEFGPRALGNRSILADPRNKEMKDLVNKKVKFREMFRPFAPVVLEEKASEFYGCSHSPFMMFTTSIKEGCNMIPAVTHIDGSARIQTVNRNDNQRLYTLLTEFYKQTRCPVLLNTSFNVMGEPIVCSPRDAIKTFSKSGIDILVINNYIIEK